MISERPTVVCLCGSTRFKDEFIRENARLTGEGKIVLSVGFFVNSGQEVTPEQKVKLDELHKRKIDLADEVFVINVDGYIGESTKSEIEYAKAHDKPVSYLERSTYTNNEFLVCLRHHGVCVQRALALTGHRVLTPFEARRFAAWLVATAWVADKSDGVPTFESVLEAVMNT